MESRHIRVDHADAIDSKRHLLNAELHLIQMMKRVKGFKHFRKKELAFKTEFKSAVNYVKNKANDIIALIPDEPEAKLEKKAAQKTKGSPKEKDKEAKTLQTELEDIKRRLQALQ